ncbi:MAG: TRAP transporter small permease [Candidatus Competibacteraceae bacterium]|nr:TRAP transporter small permease [Candidatus Competibacteraceae bacterium]
MDHQKHPDARPSQGWLTTLNAFLARYAMYLAVIGLLTIVAIVVYQVFGRYVLNRPPTWAESLALVLILYVTLFGAAAGVRDAGHIGMESLLVLLPEKARNQIELLIHGLVILFALAMIYNGIALGAQANYKIPNLPLQEWVRYVPLVLGGIMIVLFSIEHILAALKGEEVIPSWH